MKLSIVRYNCKKNMYYPVLMTTITKIRKEDLGRVSFSARTLLSSADKAKDLLTRLKSATSLGNLEHGKVIIRFLTTQGLHEVYTTIWHADEEHVMLKGGTAIPVKSITELLY
ncbi:MAG: hypothetical protein JNK73_02590 [Bacteroidia bacterium]|nr:hypothetical protein [Bacteroidia bacterium]